jgi:ABC-2 type transport system permease protein
MTRLARAEMLKLRTARVSYGLLLTSAFLTALFATLEAARAGNGASGVTPLSTASGLSTVTTVTGFSMLLAAVLGVIVASGEFRHNTATVTYLATPDRARVLVAKAVAAACAGALFGLVSSIIATGVGLAFVAAQGDHVALGTGAIVGHAAGAVLAAALLGSVGVAAGSLVRSQLAGVIGIFVWGVVIESVIGGLFTSVRPYLPYTAATTMAAATLGGAAFGPAHGLSGGGPLPFVAAAALVAGVAAALSLVAARTTLLSDVT